MDPNIVSSLKLAKDRPTFSRIFVGHLMYMRKSREMGVDYFPHISTVPFPFRSARSQQSVGRLISLLFQTFPSVQVTAIESCSLHEPTPYFPPWDLSADSS